MILLTGATGYIGSHTWVELVNSGFEVLGLDNFSNSNPKVLQRISTLIQEPALFVEGDVSNQQVLNKLFTQYSIDAVIHFAAFKAVGESVANPLMYYRNNLQGLIQLLEAMKGHAVHNFVFSSSATVYGNPHAVPIQENFPLVATSPYGWTKLVGEQILRDLCLSDSDWNVATLRYFNPVGAHSSGLIGEDPRGVPNNLMPYLTQVAVGKRDSLSVFGGDWPTPDGTGVRDYIHVTDLAKGHVMAVNYLLREQKSLTVNLGTGRGYSVLAMIAAFEQASGKKIPYEIVGRRSGDVASCYASPDLAKEILGWSAQLDLNQMCMDSWRWQSMNPNGYAD